MTLGSGPGIRRADREPGETVGVVREAVERMCAEAVSSIVLVVVVVVLVGGFGSGGAEEAMLPLGVEAVVEVESWWAEEM